MERGADQGGDAAASTFVRPIPGSGRGLTGAAQRAKIFGGSFEAGPHGTGWRDDDVIRVLLVDDQELIRTGFALILSTSGAGGGPSVEVVGEAGDGVQALRVMQRLAEQDRLPNVVLMDVRMPGMDGIEATRLIVRDYPDSRVLVLTTFDLDEYALDAIEAGAGGFLLKDARAPELVAAVRSVAEGDAVMAASLTRRLISRLRDRVHPVILAYEAGVR